MILVVWKSPIRDFNRFSVLKISVGSGVYPFSQNHGEITPIERKLSLKGPILSHFPLP